MMSFLFQPRYPTTFGTWSITSRSELTTFAYNARMAAQREELLTGECDFEFYSWLQPLVETVNQMRSIKRYAPTTAEVIPFQKKMGEAG
jgi:hypothetical protein